MSLESIAPIALEAIELRRIALPLVSPFRTSFGTETARDILLVRAVTADGEGWGECVAGNDPLYSSEYVEAAEHVLRHHLIPRLATHRSRMDAHEIASILEPVKDHRMAKGALEAAVLDAQLRSAGVNLGAHLGATRDRVPSGVSVGIMNSLDELERVVGGYLADGYVRIKLKIEPGWDLEPVGMVRRVFGPQVPLQVDANTAYTRDDGAHLARLDEFGLLLIEQPLPEDDVTGHALIAREVGTPICLDESIVSRRAAIDAIERGACSIINIKAGRVGGYLAARDIHDLAVSRGIPVWCGGMVETGIGRAANVALAALPGFTLPGDTSSSTRFFATDITEPLLMDADGMMAVPTGPGLGVTPLPELLDELTIARYVTTASGSTTSFARSGA